MFVLCAAGGACGDGAEGGGSGGGEAVDSAGVRLVVSARPAWRAGEAWTVESEPLFSVGDGDPSFQRIVDLLPLDDGRLVVVDAGSGRLRWLGPDGSVLAVAGGLGEGPEEVRRPAGLVGLSADTVAVWDAASQALVAFVDGLPALRSPLPTYGGGSLQKPLSLGSGVLAVPAREAVGDRPLDANGRARFPAPVLRWDRTSDGYDTLAVAPTDEIMTMRIGGRPALGVPPFAKLTTFAAREGRLFVGDGEARVDEGGRSWMQVDEYDASGALRARFRAPAPRGAVAPADRESYIGILEGMARTPQEVAMLPALRTSIVFPERHPAYGGLLVDDAGHLWLRTGPVTPPAPPEGPWAVLSPEGRWLGTVETPPRFDLRAVRGDRLMGVWRDAADVEHVRVYRLAGRGDG